MSEKNKPNSSSATPMSDAPEPPASELARRAERAGMRITLTVIAALFLPSVVADLLA